MLKFSSVVCLRNLLLVGNRTHMIIIITLTTVTISLSCTVSTSLHLLAKSHNSLQENKRTVRHANTLRQRNTALCIAPHYAVKKRSTMTTKLFNKAEQTLEIWRLNDVQTPQLPS